MPRLSFHQNVMSEIEEVSVVEVYEIASEIGAECEKLIDLYGSNCVESLIKKCITALEMLETLACKNERETSLIQELNDRIAKLENEKAERAETKRKFEKVKGVKNLFASIANSHAHLKHFCESFSLLHRCRSLKFSAAKRFAKCKFEKCLPYVAGECD